LSCQGKLKNRPTVIFRCRRYKTVFLMFLWYFKLSIAQRTVTIVTLFFKYVFGKSSSRYVIKFLKEIRDEKGWRGGKTGKYNYLMKLNWWILSFIEWRLIFKERTQEVERGSVVPTRT
jgi:hypothetical protein